MIADGVCYPESSRVPHLGGYGTLSRRPLERNMPTVLMNPPKATRGRKGRATKKTPTRQARKAPVAKQRKKSTGRARARSGFVSGALLTTVLATAGGAIVAEIAADQVAKWASDRARKAGQTDTPFLASNYGKMAVKAGTGAGFYFAGRKFLPKYAAPMAIGAGSSALISAYKEFTRKSSDGTQAGYLDDQSDAEGVAGYIDAA